MELTEFIELNKSAGQKWFSEGAMSFFNTRIELWIPSCEYFITSEKAPGLPRRYSIRIANRETGKVQNCGAFQEFTTLLKTKNYLEAIIGKEL